MRAKFPSSQEVELNPKHGSNQSLWSSNELQSQVRVTNVALDLATTRLEHSAALPVDYYSLDIVSHCVGVRSGIMHPSVNQVSFNIFTAIICLPSLFSVDCTCNTGRLCDHGDSGAASCFANPSLKKPRQ